MFIEAIPHSSANGTISSWQQSQIAIFTALSGYSGPIVAHTSLWRFFACRGLEGGSMSNSAIMR